MKTRLLGAFVLIALLVLFVPMFFPSSPPTAAGDQTVSLAIPPAPDRDLQTKTMSLDPDASAPAAAASAGAVVIPAANTGGSSDQLATVDIRSRRPTDVETGDGASAPPPLAPTPAAPAAATPSPATPPPSAAPEPAAVKPAASEPVIKSRSPAAEPPKAIAPALPPATAARGNYSLNLSAYASSAGARSLMQRVQKLGYPVSSHVIQQGGKTLTAVEAGPFATRTAAESARLKITQSIAGVPVRLESGASTPAGDEPASTAPKAAARAGGWAVQVAAMSSQADANALRDKLRAAGFDGFVDSVVAGGKKLWRVRAGPQTQRSDAERVRDQIKSKLGLAGNVVSVP